MSRSGYSDDCDGWALIRWRGAVASAIRGKRGQEFLREIAGALDAMPTKALVAHSFAAEGGVCTLGAVCQRRDVPMPKIEYDSDEWYDFDARSFARNALAIPDALGAEIMDLNDNGWYDETPEHRWSRMRRWVAEHIKEPTP